MHRVVHDVLRAVFLLRRQLLEALLGVEQALARRAVHRRQRRGREAEGPQRVLHGGQLPLHAHEQHVVLLLVRADGKELRLLVHLSDRGLRVRKLDASGHRAQQHAAALGPLEVQRQIEPEPGLQRLDHRALAALLGGDALDARVAALDRLGHLQRARQARVVQQDAVLQLGLGRQQLRLLRRVDVQQLDRVHQRGVL